MELRTEARFLSLPQLNMQCLFLVVSAINFPIDEELRNNLSISGTILYILTYAIGAGPVTGLIIPELNSSRTRGKIMSFSFSVHWKEVEAVATAMGVDPFPLSYNKFLLPQTFNPIQPHPRVRQLHEL
ncbi:hypothetical protein L6452_18943 [Arctium lappa]|uniref:Uncharacterized protein n=1 Tax=Arctium lappa TaxID=4217 RepID=A0ACB9B7M3_ARCLA|nr:hypothetical protein L6452_18943 [Arctium lappa]